MKGPKPGGWSNTLNCMPPSPSYPQEYLTPVPNAGAVWSMTKFMLLVLTWDPIAPYSLLDLRIFMREAIPVLFGLLLVDARCATFLMECIFVAIVARGSLYGV